MIATALAIGLFAAACAAPGPQSDGSPLEGAWELESGTVKGAAVPIVEGYRITFTSQGSSFRGTAACNGYGGLIGIEAWAMTISELTVTEMACMPPVMESEQAYLAALQLVGRASREGDTLVMSGSDAELVFTAVPPVSEQALIGTVWMLESLIDGDAAIQAVGDDSGLVFRADGTLAAGTGCRTLTGTYVAVGDEIETPELSAEGDCTRELEGQDSHVVSVFEGGFTVEIDGDRLTLTAAGNEGLVYRSS